MAKGTLLVSDDSQTVSFTTVGTGGKTYAVSGVAVEEEGGNITVNADGTIGGLAGEASFSLKVGNDGEVKTYTVSDGFLSGDGGFATDDTESVQQAVMIGTDNSVNVSEIDKMANYIIVEKEESGTTTTTTLHISSTTELATNGTATVISADGSTTYGTLSTDANDGVYTFAKGNAAGTLNFIDINFAGGTVKYQLGDSVVTATAGEATIDLANNITEVIKFTISHLTPKVLQVLFKLIKRQPLLSMQVELQYKRLPILVLSLKKNPAIARKKTQSVLLPRQAA